MSSLLASTASIVAATEGGAAALTFAGVLDSSETFYEDDLTDTSIPDIQKITKRNNILPLWGNTHTMNLNALVLENVVSSTYYKNFLSEASGFQQLADEIYYNVKHLEPWERGTRKTQGMTGMCGGVRGVGAGGVVSTAFCILYKMFTLRLTRKQLVSLVNHTDSPYLRGIGFMYIRYCQPPSDLWAWMEPYLVSPAFPPCHCQDDEEEIDPRSGGGDQLTIGQVVKMMLQKLDWYGTLFPRIPVPIQKEIEAKFRERAKADMERLREIRDERDRERDRDKQPGRDRSPEARTSRSDGRSRDASTRRSRSPRDRRGDDPSKSSASDGRRKHGGHHYRCAHHKRHHHCSKHRERCPSKAKKSRLGKEKSGNNGLSSGERSER